MPDWLVALVSVAASTAVSTAVAFFLKANFKKYLDEKEAKEAKQKADEIELEERRRKEAQEKLTEKINEIVENHTKPIDTQLVKVNDKLGKVADGTLDTLRDRILSSYYKCLEKGYRTQYDIDNVEHMYKDYLNLEGNTFVAECVGKFKNIPTEQEYQIQKQKELEARLQSEEAMKKSKRAKGRKPGVAKVTSDKK